MKHIAEASDNVIASIIGWSGLKSLREQFDFSPPQPPEPIDERIVAWDELVLHPFFAECFDTDDTLLSAMLRKLSAAPLPAEGVAELIAEGKQAERGRSFLSPVEASSLIERLTAALSGADGERDRWQEVALDLTAKMSRPTPSDEELERLCEVSHIAYEEAASASGWETNTYSRVAWQYVPEANKVAMRASVKALVAALTTPEGH